MHTAVNRYMFVWCIVLSMLCTGCDWLSSDQSRSLRDGRIAANLHAAVHVDPRLSGAEVRFRVRDGEVHIDVDALTERQRALVVAAAWDVPGVTRVVDLKGLGEVVAGPNRPAFGLLKDLSAVVALKQQLRVKGVGSSVQIDIDGEQVTLFGEVSSRAERRSIVETLLDDPEISQVIDHTRLESEPSEEVDWRSSVDDSIITAQTRLAIRLNRRLAGSRIKIKTRRSAVTLYGSVDSPELAELAERIAADIAGVTEVVNQLSIKPAAAETIQHRPPTPDGRKTRTPMDIGPRARGLLPRGHG